MRTPWFRKTLFPKLKRPPRAQEISTILNLRDRIVSPSPTFIVPSALAAHGPSTDRLLPATVQCRRKRHDHQRIFSPFHTAPSNQFTRARRAPKVFRNTALGCQ